MDLSPAAVKIARRIQSLQDGHTYTLTLTKLSGDKWLLSVGEGAKVEVAK